MAKASKEEQRKAPILRFKGFTNDWEQRKLGDIAYIKGRIGWKSLKQSEYVEEGPALIASKHISSGKINWNSVDHIPDWRYEESPEIMLELNDIIFSKDGSIGNPAVITFLPNRATINSTMMLVRLDKNILVPCFFYQILVSNQFKKLIFEKTSGSSIPHIFQNDMKKFKFYSPQQGEQRKISNMLNILDNLIALYERKVKLFSKVKKYFLDNLFAEKEYPNLRFKGFTDAWEQRKLGNLFNERKEKSTEGELLSVTLSNGVVKFSKLNKKDNSNIKSGNYKVVKKNDIPYNSMRMWQGASGVSLYDGIVSPAYTVLIPNKDSNSNFYAVLFKKKSTLNLFTRFSQGLTSDTWNLKYPLLKDINVPFTNLEEQERIFKIFNTVDNLIVLYENKKQHFIKIKKTLLDTMFI